MRKTEGRNQTSRDVACNGEAVLPRTPENPDNQGDLWYQELSRSAAKRAFGRSKTQRQENSKDP